MSQQETHGFGSETSAFDIYTGTSDDEGFGILESSTLKRVFVSGKSSNSRAVISSSNMSNHAAPLIDEVFSRHPSSSFIVCAHEVGCEALKFSVDQYIGKSLAINSIKRSVVFVVEAITSPSNWRAIKCFTSRASSSVFSSDEEIISEYPR